MCQKVPSLNFRTTLSHLHDWKLIHFSRHDVKYDNDKCCLEHLNLCCFGIKKTLVNIGSSSAVVIILENETGHGIQIATTPEFHVYGERDPFLDPWMFYGSSK